LIFVWNLIFVFCDFLNYRIVAKVEALKIIAMKPLKFLMMATLITIGGTASAQQRLVNNNVRELRQRLNALQLTQEQKIKLTNLIKKERMQFYMNQKELNEILTDKQKEQLLAWRNKRFSNKSDSTAVADK
jgi:Spy/CpxP family protein refolding chaperone